MQYNNKASISTVSTNNASPFSQLTHLQRGQMRQEQLPALDLSLKIDLPRERLQQGQHRATDQETRLARLA